MSLDANISSKIANTKWPMAFSKHWSIFLASPPDQCNNIDSINSVSLGRDCLFGWSMADWAVFVKPVWKQSLFMQFYLMLVGLLNLFFYKPFVFLALINSDCLSNKMFKVIFLNNMFSLSVAHKLLTHVHDGVFSCMQALTGLCGLWLTQTLTIKLCISATGTVYVCVF